jgi:hypothetical protein
MPRLTTMDGSPRTPALTPDSVTGAGSINR